MNWDTAPRALAEQPLAEALRAGRVELLELRYVEQRREAIGREDRRPPEQSVSSSRGFGVRALASGGGGFACTPELSMHRDLGALDIEGPVAEAIDHAKRGRDPASIEPGAYDVVIEPAGVSQLLEWLAMTSLGAREVSQGTSLVAGRHGQALMGERFSLEEDAAREDPLAFGVPFDSEGVTRRRVPLFERGVAREVLSDRAWARRAGGRSTGNAPLGGVGEGPSPSSLWMAGG